MALLPRSTSSRSTRLRSTLARVRELSRLVLSGIPSTSTSTLRPRRVMPKSLRLRLESERPGTLLASKAPRLGAVARRSLSSWPSMTVTCRVGCMSELSERWSDTITMGSCAVGALTCAAVSAGEAVAEVGSSALCFACAAALICKAPPGKACTDRFEPSSALRTACSAVSVPWMGLARKPLTKAGFATMLRWDWSGGEWSRNHPFRAVLTTLCGETENPLSFFHATSAGRFGVDGNQRAQAANLHRQGLGKRFQQQLHVKLEDAEHPQPRDRGGNPDKARVVGLDGIHHIPQGPVVHRQHPLLPGSPVHDVALQAL